MHACFYIQQNYHYISMYGFMYDTPQQPLQVVLEHSIGEGQFTPIFMSTDKMYTHIRLPMLVVILANESAKASIVVSCFCWLCDCCVDNDDRLPGFGGGSLSGQTILSSCLRRRCSLGERITRKILKLL